MSADALRLRRARRAIYGPPITALIGVAFIAAGLTGLVVTNRSSSDAPPSVLVPPVAVEAASAFTLIDAQGQMYPGGRVDTSTAAATAIPPDTTVAAATLASLATGGHWLATRDGQVIGVGALAFGGHRVPKGAPPIVGIAASQSAGYWLARADGQVYAFGSAQHHGELTAKKEQAAVVGIAANRRGGYWLARADGTVRGFGMPEKTASVKGRHAPIVGIAADPGGGFWLAARDGRVFAFDAAHQGDTRRIRPQPSIVDIAASPDGGYWLTTASGRVYGFGDTGGEVVRPAPGIDRIVAITPR
jgi:hypothetical protein